MPQDHESDPNVGQDPTDTGLEDTAVMGAEDHAAISPAAIGDHVLYRLPTGPARGELRAAIVTYVHADDAVNLAVLCGLASDLPMYPVCPAENIRHGNQLGQFIWPGQIPA